jgi:signal transduction histidine kinase
VQAMVARVNQIAIVVDDSGPGVPVEHRQRLFEPFFTTRSDGTGLGLANASKIAREHGGQIRLEERPGAGARFVLEIPAVSQTTS